MRNAWWKHVGDVCQSGFITRERCIFKIYQKDELMNTHPRCTIRTSCKNCYFYMVLYQNYFSEEFWREILYYMKTSCVRGLVWKSAKLDCREIWFLAGKPWKFSCNEVIICYCIKNVALKFTSCICFPVK